MKLVILVALLHECTTTWYPCDPHAKKWMVNFIIPKTTVDTCVVNTNSSQNSKKSRNTIKNKKQSKHNIYIYNPNKQLKIQNKSDKQKINNIQTTGKQRLNRRLRKNKQIKNKQMKLCCNMLILKETLGKKMEI